MRYLNFGAEEKSTYKICILVPTIRKDEILRHYIEPYGLNPDDVIVMDLHQNPTKKKTPAAEQKAYIQEELTPVLTDLGVELLIVGDGDYFKTFSKAAKVDAMVGYVLPTSYGPWHVAYVPNFRAIFYDPDKVTAKISAGINAIKRWLDGTYQPPGIDIIKFSAYPNTVEDVANWLQKLSKYDALTCDIEAFSLKHYDAGIGTITFCWSETEGIAFPVDCHDDPEYGREVRGMLKAFFEAYDGTMIYHNIAYDVYVLIYQLFMDHILDQEGLLYGLDVMLKDWHDTKLIAYLATNSCAGNKLGLKDQAQEYAGNYAQDEIKDIRKIPLPQLLQYNLVDGLSTWFTFNKNYGRMVRDQQKDVYETLFKPAIKDIIQMQLTGMPVYMPQVKKVKGVLEAIHQDAEKRIQESPIVGRFTHHLNEKWVDKRNSELKVKRVSIADAKEVFNPGSPKQLSELLYEQLALPVLELTDTKQPATGGDVLKALKSHTKDPIVLGFLDAIIDYKAVDKILSAFIPALESAQLGIDGWHYLFGNFNLGGTVSGRLSSSGPNLQNLPANVFMILSQILLDRFPMLAEFTKKGALSLGKLIKSCFRAPPGWFFGGIDFDSLEDRISAVTTKDPNKIKVYTDGYDGHCLRAYSYFKEQMPDIIDGNVESINSIAKKYPVQRQDSKPPTFALTYQGTYITLMNNCGFSESQAKEIEERYHVLYASSTAWVQAKLDQATIDGYVTVAFGLRVRTPLLHQVVRGTAKTPFAAEAEGRTAGNALGQSWCLLNSRASSEFLTKVRASEYRLDIKPCAQIHDAGYYLFRDNVDVIEFANIHVVKACQWQEHPDIQNDQVKLGGSLGLFYPDWSKEAQIPNGASKDEIFAVFSEHIHELEKAA